MGGQGSKFRRQGSRRQRSRASKEMNPMTVQYKDVHDLGDLPDSIPMVKKKSRGRPRKYPRLDDVLRYKNSLESDIIEEDVKMEERETNDGDAGDFYEIGILCVLRGLRH